MKITAFLSYYEPETASSLYLAKNLMEGLADRGHEVDLYVPRPSRGVSDFVRAKYKRNRTEILMDGRLRIHRFFSPREGRNPVGRALRYALNNLICIAKGIRADGDVIFIESTPPTQGMMAGMIKAIKKTPVAYGLQDVFPDSMVNSGMMREGSAMESVGRWIESKTYKAADAIIVISQDIRENILAKGVSPAKVSLIPNWVEYDAIYPIPRNENPLITELGLREDAFYVVYAGSVGYAQNVDVLLEASLLTRETPDIEYIIFGTGSEMADCQKRAKEFCCENVSFYPLLPYERSAEVYSLADLALVSCRKGFGSAAMPSKTWNILSCGTPILLSFDDDTELASLIRREGLGYFSEADDARMLAQAILTAYRDRETLSAISSRCRPYVIKNLNKEELIDQYSEAMEAVASHGK